MFCFSFIPFNHRYGAISDWIFDWYFDRHLPHTALQRMHSAIALFKA